MKGTPKYFFLFFPTMVTLYISAVSLLALWFQYVNYLFPDEVYQNYDFYSSGMRFAIASLIVIFPLYIFFTRLSNQAVRKEPELRDFWIRKWLIYITLFVAGTTLVVDLIMVINTFLGGELTTRFILKALAVLIVIGAGFVYYWQDLKGFWETRESLSKTIGAITVIAVLGSVVAGFFIMGSPSTQRALRLDQDRVGDLQSIQWQVVNYWQQKQVLPDSLNDLQDPIMGFVAPTDPVTGEAYGYTQTDDLSFELCASFDAASTKDRLDRPMMSEAYGLMGNPNWEHPAGAECFERTIDPELYPPRAKGI